MTKSYSEICGNYPKKLAENLWMLGNYYFNLYLIVGDNYSAIVEMGVSGIVDSVIGQLEYLDVQPDYLIVAHPHADHITGLSGLQEKFPAARVVAGEGAWKFVTHPKAIEGLLFEDTYISRMLQSKGYQPGRPPVKQPPDFGDFLLVLEGDEIDLGNFTLQVMALKGHSPGGIGIHVPEVGALMVSDSLGFHYPQRGFLPLFLTGFDEYMVSIDRLFGLHPEILCLAHQGPLISHDVEQAFALTKKTSYDLLRRIVDKKENKNEMIETIFQECYKDEFQMYSENNVRNTCSLLVRRGLETL